MPQTEKQNKKNEKHCTRSILCCHGHECIFLVWSSWSRATVTQDESKREQSKITSFADPHVVSSICLPWLVKLTLKFYLDLFGSIWNIWNVPACTEVERGTSTCVCSTKFSVEHNWDWTLRIYRVQNAWTPVLWDFQSLHLRLPLTMDIAG